MKRIRTPRKAAIAVREPLPDDVTDAIAWAVRAKPDGWGLGEWLGRLMPAGSWDGLEDEELADCVVGAAIRGMHEKREGEKA